MLLTDLMIAEGQCIYSRGMRAYVTEDMYSMESGAAEDDLCEGQAVDLYAMALATLNGHRSQANRSILR